MMSRKKRPRPSLPWLLLLALVGSIAVSWLAFSRSPRLDHVPRPHRTLTATAAASTLLPPSTEAPEKRNTTTASKPARIAAPYHDWDLFASDFDNMLQNLKIFVYPDALNSSSPFANVFLPHPDPLHPKLGNYFSEHMFKISLLRSRFLTSDPVKTSFFFLPFSINALRNDPRVRSEVSIADFIAQYTTRISREYEFWNASEGSNHFYVCCHSVGRDAALKHAELRNNAIQVACSSSYFQRLYTAHKDVGLPQVWPRPLEEVPNPPNARLH
ncbi:probable glycosyltransferase At5g25310 isoform X2 [Phoenix dactylifera]|uniref:Probable glycosyltransferase At5g25310 isoform X2 n=1 Tax=Phoenix dactylifera TaxID=42345 RepID=A0A8B7BYN0_PHODC|nr:probable glycosyltransferase At5g25310 isoform X2 [Phoenix dactylifera]